MLASTKRCLMIKDGGYLNLVALIMEKGVVELTQYKPK